MANLFVLINYFIKRVHGQYDVVLNCIIQQMWPVVIMPAALYIVGCRFWDSFRSRNLLSFFPRFINHNASIAIDLIAMVPSQWINYNAPIISALIRMYNFIASLAIRQCQFPCNNAMHEIQCNFVILCIQYVNFNVLILMHRF